MFISQLRRQVFYGRWGQFMLTVAVRMTQSDTVPGVFPVSLRPSSWGIKKPSHSLAFVLSHQTEISKYSFVQFPRQTSALHVSIRYCAHRAVWKVFLCCVGDGIRTGILWLENKNNLRGFFYPSHLCYFFLDIQMFLISAALVNNCINHLHYFCLKVLLKWLGLHKVSGAHLAH